MIRITIEIDNENGKVVKAYGVEPAIAFHILNLLESPKFPTCEQFVERWAGVNMTKADKSKE